MIWGLSLSEILKRMKCDTSAFPLFQFKKKLQKLSWDQTPFRDQISNLAPFTQYAFKGRFLVNDAI